MNEKKLRKALAHFGDEDESGDEGLDAAREFARWYLGDSGWADEILGAYLDPEDARTRVARERGPR